MTTKDFRRVANVIAEQRAALTEQRRPEGEVATLDDTARALAATFTEAYPRFDVERFLTACGVTA